MPPPAAQIDTNANDMSDVWERSFNGGALRILASAGHQHDPRGRRQNTRREDGTLWGVDSGGREEIARRDCRSPDLHRFAPAP